MSCAIPRKIYITKKPLSPVLPESPIAVKPKAIAMSPEKLARKVAKFHMKNKYNLNTFRQNLEVKKLKDALEARKGKSADYPIEIFEMPNCKMRIKNLAEKEIRIFQNL